MAGSYHDLQTTVMALVASQNVEHFHDWLRNNKLLSKSCKCKSCFSEMVYISDIKVPDKLSWVCQQHLCNKGLTISIREASFFDNVPKTIDLFHVFKLLLLWCEGRTLSSIKFESDKQHRTAKQVFLQCDKIAEIQMKKEWPGKPMVGGNHGESLVLMDMYPNGYMLGNNNKAITGEKSDVKNYSTKGHNSFLCFADINFMPPKVWVHLLRQGDKIPHLVQSIVHSDTILITNECIIPAERLRQDAGYRAVDVETLHIFDSSQNNIYSNIGTIWENVLPILIEAENLPMYKTRLIISKFLWHQRFAKSPEQALYNFLVQVTQHFQLVE